MSHDNGKTIGNNKVKKECMSVHLHRLDCMACAMKQLIKQYWSDDPVFLNPDPRPLIAMSPALQRIILWQ
jgi:hypothetical protein